MKTIIAACILLLASINGQSQSTFSLQLEAINIDNLGGLQSYAVGQSNGKWLVVGGRLDGLHRRQPWASFDLAGHNDQLWVIDPVNEEVWTADLSTLPTSTQEQLRSTNMQFSQEGDYLYCLGGYGYSSAAQDHTTFPQLTAIDVPSTIQAIINQTSFANHIRTITDNTFQVTGGQLRKMNGHFYLMGGQKFIGRYNPMGPTSGPGFIQEYTDAYYAFDIVDDGQTITINHLSTTTDASALHRRDYNAEAQIMPNGDEGLTMFSGVFRTDIDLPYLDAVNIDANGYAVQTNFTQYYNHYHCPVVPFYDAQSNTMHTIFFGGIAQYYQANGQMVQDNNVPFVKTIAQVTRDANGQMTESLLPIEMPGLLGAGAQFIVAPNIDTYSNEVIKYDNLSQDSVLLGYIYGGINSTAPNIFFINNGTQSTASEVIYAVYLTKENTSSVENISAEKAIRIYPNPTSGQLTIELESINDTRADLRIHSLEGKLLYEQEGVELIAGRLTLEAIIEVASQQVVVVTLSNDEFQQKQLVLFR